MKTEIRTRGGVLVESAPAPLYSIRDRLIIEDVHYIVEDMYAEHQVNDKGKVVSTKHVTYLRKA